MNNDEFLSAIEELKSRVIKKYGSMETQELALSILAIRLDELALNYNTEIGAEDHYCRNVL